MRGAGESAVLDTGLEKAGVVVAVPYSVVVVGSWIEVGSEVLEPDPAGETERRRKSLRRVEGFCDSWGSSLVMVAVLFGEDVLVL